MGDKNTARNMFFVSTVQRQIQKFQKIFADVRWSNLKFMLIFTHAPLFANMSGLFFSYDPQLLGLDAESWMRIAYCFGAGWLFLFATMKNMRIYARFLAIFAAIFFFAWLVFTDGVLGVLLSIGFALFYGGCGVVAVFHFSYMLNDAERFLGALLTSLFYVLFQFDCALGLSSSLFNRTYMTGLVIVTLICILSYKEEEYSTLHIEEEKIDFKLHPEERKRVYLTFYFFFAYHIVEMFYTYMQGGSSPLLIFASGIGGAAVIVISLCLYMVTRFNLWYMSNLFFLTMFMSYILLFWGNTEVWLIMSRVFHGGEQIGFIASYCMLWGTFQLYVSFKKFKKILIVTLNVFFIVYAFLGKVVSVNLSSLPLLSCVLTFCMFLFFLLLSPSYAYVVFRKEDGKECSIQTESSLEEWREWQTKKMEFYKLTDREKQVCRLLLDGYFIKEIAAELQISVDTVKFHVKNIYKKLEISGKTEFFALFHFLEKLEKK